jgi:Sugar (and other) transporter
MDLLDIFQITKTFVYNLCCRKGGLLLNNFLGIGGACLMGVTKIAHSYEILFLGRFIIGVNCGE